MGKQTTLEAIREWIGGIAFQIFLWSIGLNQDQYITALMQEEVRRKDGIQIPEWEDAEIAVKNGSSTSLDAFVYDYEPAGRGDDIKFREQLQDVVNYIASLASAGEAFLQHTLDFHPRAAKLMILRRNFLVVSKREPYYVQVYKMIRDQEMRQSTWTDEDEQIFIQETNAEE